MRRADSDVLLLDYLVYVWPTHSRGVGLKALPHRHTAAHTIIVLEGRLAVNDKVVGAGAYCHFPAGETMFHAPTSDESCLFVIVFHGPFDVEALGDHSMAGSE